VGDQVSHPYKTITFPIHKHRQPLSLPQVLHIAKCSPNSNGAPNKFHSLLNRTSARPFSVALTAHAWQHFILVCSESRPAFLHQRRRSVDCVRDACADGRRQCVRVRVTENTRSSFSPVNRSIPSRGLQENMLCCVVMLW
jgi:hypothetical protein